MLDDSMPMKSSPSNRLNLRSVIRVGVWRSGLLLATSSNSPQDLRPRGKIVRTEGIYSKRGGLFSCALACLLSLPICAQQADPKTPVVVQPGAAGQSTKTLPSSTRATLPPYSPKDVEFMQGMIMHHAQAVEMTALIESRTENKELRSLGTRISRSQADEIDFMKRWLTIRGEPISPKRPEMRGMDMSSHQMLMPGMLTPKQMDALRNAKGEEFDRLFLKGMIQHHGGALIMVKELFDNAGAGQDAELFNFATDVDNSQRAEIRIMQKMLEEKP